MAMLGTVTLEVGLRCVLPYPIQPISTEAPKLCRASRPQPAASPQVVYSPPPAPVQVALTARYWTWLFGIFVFLSYFLVFPFITIFPLLGALGWGGVGRGGATRVPLRSTGAILPDLSVCCRGVWRGRHNSPTRQAGRRRLPTACTELNTKACCPPMYCCRAGHRLLRPRQRGGGQHGARAGALPLLPPCACLWPGAAHSPILPMACYMPGLA